MVCCTSKDSLFKRNRKRQHESHVPVEGEGEVLSKETVSLFGKEFQDNLVESAKQNQKSKDLCAALKEGSKPTKKKPFHTSSSVGSANIGEQRNLALYRRKPWSNSRGGDHKIIQFALARRLKHFQKQWKVLTHDPNIIRMVKGYKIPFSSVPFQKSLPHQKSLQKEELSLVREEIEPMLRKKAIKPQKDQFLSNLFLIPKKDGEQRPVINLKQLNSHIPYVHFKMEGLHLLKEMLQEGTSCAR